MVDQSFLNLRASKFEVRIRWLKWCMKFLQYTKHIICSMICLQLWILHHLIIWSDNIDPANTEYRNYVLLKMSNNLILIDKSLSNVWYVQRSDSRTESQDWQYLVDSWKRVHLHNFIVWTTVLINPSTIKSSVLFWIYRNAGIQMMSIITTMCTIRFVIHWRNVCFLKLKGEGISQQSTV